MIEAKVPKDIRVYETKLVGPFTLRNTICLTLAIVAALITYNVCCEILGFSVDVFIYIGTIVTLPFLAFGWITIEGMHLEKYIKTIVIYNFLVPADRKQKKIIYKFKEEKKNALSAKEIKRRKKILESDPQFKKYL